MNKKIVWALILFISLGIVAITASMFLSRKEVRSMQTVRVVRSFPHDDQAFSQGFVVEGNTLYEGTGKYGASTLRKVDLMSGKVQSSVPLAENQFGEGVTVIGDRIYQLTWREQICFVYDKATLKLIESVRYVGEGWGLADDEKHLYMSDGSSKVTVRDAKTLKVVREFTVKEGKQRIKELNEMEFVNGELWANVWHKDQIVRIDPQSGTVLGWIDCSLVYPMNKRPDLEHALNGIAVDATNDRLFITGKNWPKVFEIEVVDIQSAP